MSTRKPWFTMLFALLFACVGPSFAQGPPAVYTPAQLGAIREVQIRVSENRDAVSAGDATRVSAEARVARIMARLNASLPTSLTEAALMGINIPNVIPRMTTAERKSSFFAGVDFLRLGLIGVFTLLALLLVGKHLVQALITLPKELWEIGAYGGGLGILVAQGAGFMAINQFWAIFGCLLTGGGLGLTLVIHKNYFRMGRGRNFDEMVRAKFYLQYTCPTVMLAAFSAATLITGSAWMGAFAALSLMVLLGFAGEVIPFGFAVGFKDNDALSRGTSAGLMVMLLFMGLHAANVTGSVFRAFEPGSLVVGGFVGFLGLLIAGSDRYRNRQGWLAMQAIVLAVCFAGVIGASILGLKSIQIIAGVFLALWTIEKMVEIPGDGFVPWVLKLMGASGALYLVVTYGAPFYAQYLIY